MSKKKKNTNQKPTDDFQSEIEPGLGEYFKPSHEDEKPVRWYNKLNPCDGRSYGWTMPFYKLFNGAWKFLTKGTDCECCLGARFLLWLALAFLAGAVANAWSSV